MQPYEEIAAAEPPHYPYPMTLSNLWRINLAFQLFTVSLVPIEYYGEY
jgi:hypothetical protein